VRTPPLLAAGLLVTAVLTGCSDDRPRASGSTPRPSTAGSASPTPSGPGSASSGSATSGPAAPTTAPTTATTAGPTDAPAAGGATATTSPTSTATVVAAPAAPGQVRLTGDGIALPGRVLAFGTTYEQARPALDAALGAPTTDTGVTESFGPYGTCPGTRLRGLEYGGGALRLLFGDVDGAALTLYHWGLTGEGSPARVPQASALVGDRATFAFGVGTSVEQLRAGARTASLDVAPGDEVFPANFRLDDQSAGFFGYLTGTDPGDTATFVQGGDGCGE